MGRFESGPSFLTSCNCSLCVLSATSRAYLVLRRKESWRSFNATSDRAGPRSDPGTVNGLNQSKHCAGSLVPTTTLPARRKSSRIKSYHQLHRTSTTGPQRQALQGQVQWVTARWMNALGWGDRLSTVIQPQHRRITPDENVRPSEDTTWLRG